MDGLLESEAANFLACLNEENDFEGVLAFIGKREPSFIRSFGWWGSDNTTLKKRWWGGRKRPGVGEEQTI